MFIPDDFLSNQTRSLNASQKQAAGTERRLNGPDCPGKRESTAPSRGLEGGACGRGRSLREGAEPAAGEGPRVYLSIQGRMLVISRDFHLGGTFDLPLKRGGGASGATCSTVSALKSHKYLSVDSAFSSTDADVTHAEHLCCGAAAVVERPVVRLSHSHVHVLKIHFEPDLKREGSFLKHPCCL